MKSFEPSPLPDTRRNAAGIELIGLRKAFGAVQAVRQVDLFIAPGEIVALLGPNGAGKSTTIDLMLGLARPDAGQVSIFGATPTEAVDAGDVAAMLQTGELIRDLKVRELVAMVASLYRAPMPIDEVLALAGIDDIADRFTHKLSGGQTQRVRFAIALVPDPTLLILDEPTVAMDVEGRRGFWAAMRAFASRGKTVIFATHYLEEADEFADRIVLMAEGRIVADGSPAEVKAMVGTRVIRATVPSAGSADLGALDGVAAVEQHGDAVVLTCTDSDVALRALLARHVDAHHIEVRSGGLEAAFVQLTESERSMTQPTQSTPPAQPTRPTPETLSLESEALR
jgi:ABC-2 type transport system ATP-binding protein